jgi:hypothetical protein
MSGGRLEGKAASSRGLSSGLGPVRGAIFVGEVARVLLVACREEAGTDRPWRARERATSDQPSSRGGSSAWVTLHQATIPLLRVR